MLPTRLPFSRSIMRQRYRLMSARAASVPQPNDDPRGTVPAPTSHRVLVVGNEYAVSWGVRTHALALPGQLAHELAIRTGFGADVDVLANPGMSIIDVLDSLDGHALDVYDAVVVLTGVGDAFQLLSPLRWAAHVKTLLTELTATLTPATPVMFVGIQPVSSVNITHSKQDGTIDRWAQALNEMTESVIQGLP